MKGKKTAILFIPTSRATKEISASRGFKIINQPSKKKITSKSKKGNASPKKEMNHHVCGLR